MVQTVKDSKGNVLGTFPDEATPEQIKKALAGSAAKTPATPAPRVGPTKEAAEGMPPMQPDQGPIDELFRSNPVTRPIMEYYDKPTPAPYRTQTTEGMGVGETAGELAATGMTDFVLGLRSLPRQVYDIARGDFSITHPEKPSVLGELFGDWIDTTLHNEPSQEPPSDLANAIVGGTFDERKRETYEKLGYPETIPTTPGERIYTKTVGMLPSLAIPGVGLTGTGAGMVGAGSGQTARELGAPEELATSIELLSGIFGPQAIAGLVRRTPGLSRLVQPSMRTAPMADRMMVEATRGVSDEALDEAMSLTRAAQARGQAYTIPMGAQQATAGQAPGLPVLQQFVEQSPGGEALKAAMAQTTPRATEMMEGVTQRIAGGELPAGEALQELPGRVQGQAQQSIRNMEGARSEASAENYGQALNRPVDEVLGPNAQRWNDIMNYPAIRDTFRQVQVRRANEGLPPHRWAEFDADGNLLSLRAVPTPDDIDQMLKTIQRQIDATETPTGKAVDPTNLIGARDALQRLAEETLPNYPTARFAHSQMSGPIDTMQKSPVGTIMKTEGQQAEDQLKNITKAIFPEDPYATDPTTVRMTMRQLAPGGRPGTRRAQYADPGRRQIVGTWLMRQFDEITQALKGDPLAEGGPAKFRAYLTGNPRQLQNLRAGIEEIAGPEAWADFEHALSIMEGQGYRLAPNSRTAFYQQFQEQAGQPRYGLGGWEAATAAATGGKSLLYRGMQNLERGETLARRQSTVRDLVRALTDPDAQGTWRALRDMDPNSPNAQRLLRQLLAGGALATQPGAP